MSHKICCVLFGVLVSGTLVAEGIAGKYKAIVDRLNVLQNANPNISHVYSIGTNNEGTDIFAIRISTTPMVMDPKKIGQVILSTHHGNEIYAPEFAMALIRDLLRSYQTTELFRGNLAEMEWTIVPVLNITGYNKNERHEYGVDPNRDYPSPCLSAPGGKLKSIQRVLELLKTRAFAGSVTVHGYDGSLTYPWGMYADDYHTLDHNAYHRAFGKAATKNNYKYGNGALLIYPANGCYEDFIYWKHGSWSLLLELLNGSSTDITTTVTAIRTFFDEIDSCPSTKNQFTGKCTDIAGDFRVE